MSSSDLERLSFGRERKNEELFGIYRRTTAARATDEKIRRLAQDGGVVTALLVHGLDTGYISAAVVSGVDPNRPLYPVPKVASTPQKSWPAQEPGTPILRIFSP